ncbi:hypothetical protein [Legionella sp. PC1000]|uniref:hypothetical protein n=1 Tax=Legionella sp. PC1000 TaxID=2746060 RepID=UPI0015FD5115|nr:hypothetical protein [Legionella sp. PC1000]
MQNIDPNAIANWGSNAVLVYAVIVPLGKNSYFNKYLLLAPIQHIIAVTTLSRNELYDL